jgi:signal transduction histidine kinase
MSLVDWLIWLSIWLLMCSWVCRIDGDRSFLPSVVARPMMVMCMGLATCRPCRSRVIIGRLVVPLVDSGGYVCPYDDWVAGLLRPVWDEPYLALPLSRQRWDWALVGVVVVAAVVEGVLRPGLDFRVPWVVLALVLAPTLLWRRSRPLLMVTIGFGVCGLAPFLTHGHPTDMYTMVYQLLLVFSLVRWGRGRDVVLGAAVLLANIGLWLLAGFTSLSNGAGEAVILVTTGAVGAALRYRARARMRELDQATLLERARLARDLHDTVAHHVSAMAIRAQAGLAMAPSQPEAATEALRLIEAEASRALTEMRTMVRVLRQPAELTPLPRVADLAELSGRSHTGPWVNVEILGDVDDLPPSVGATIYRLAQEAVTNARRHAKHATRIEVRVAADDTSVRLRVRDDGDAGSPGASGYGLIGMAERAGLLGGTCEAGPNPGRGWTVTAVLPRTPAA